MRLPPIPIRIDAMWKPGVVILVIASSSIAQVLPPGPPFPMDGATDVPLDVTLRWTQFGPVDSTEIFFGGGADPLSLSAAPAGVTSFMPSIATRSLYPLGTYYWRLVSRRGAVTASTPVYSFTMAGPVGMQFVPLAPCRVVDTREDLGEFGRPHLSAGVVRTFTFTQHHGCGIAGYALAYSLNVTVVPRGPLGYLAIWPGNTTRPFVSTLNSPDGRVKANAAIVTGGDGGNYISAFATNDTDLVIDINGYFTQPIFNSRALAFYPLLPCRVSDTRNPGGALGGPILGAGASRSIPVMSSNCGVPSSALAYSLNATVVPQERWDT